MLAVTTDIIEACKRNDRSAQKFVYENFFNKMFSVCRRYVKNEEEALEVLDDGFINIFKNIQQYKGEGSFEGWVRKIIINKALDHIKMNKKYKEMLHYVEDYTEEPLFVDAGIIDSCDTEALYNSIHSLPLIYQMVFNLYAIEGFSHKEIAGKLEISEGTSRWYLSESRKMLKEKLTILFQKI
jgi:RNA polymerase sigma factor (sigma-70 family)